MLKLILLSQVANGILIPFVLIFMLVLINRGRIMGDYKNHLPGNIIAWSTTIIMLPLIVAMVWSLLA